MRAADQIRWFAARNVGTSPIPPYALLMLANEEGGQATDWGQGSVVSGSVRQLTKKNFYASEQPKGTNAVRWLVAKPSDSNGDGEIDMSIYAQAAMFCVNGPTAIPVGGVGLVSQDWPLQVLHYGKYNVAPNGASVGPRSGSFSVWSGAGPFIVLSHDPADPVDSLDHVHTVWIAPKGPTTNRILWADQKINFSESDPLSLGDPIDLKDAIQTQQLEGVLSGTDYDTIVSDGLYLITFSATIWSDNAPRGSLLGISIDTKSPGDSSWTSRAVAARYQDIEKDNTGSDIQTTKENISTTCIVSLSADDLLQFSAISSYNTLLSYVHVGVVRLGNAARGIVDTLPNDDPDLEPFGDLAADPDPCTGNRLRSTPNPSGGGSGGGGGGTEPLHEACIYQGDGVGGWNLVSAGSCEVCAPPVRASTGTGDYANGTCGDGEGEGV